MSKNFPAPQLSNDAANDIRSPQRKLYDPPKKHHHFFFEVDEDGLLVHPGGSCTELFVTLQTSIFGSVGKSVQNLAPDLLVFGLLDKSAINGRSADSSSELTLASKGDFFGSTTGCSTTKLCESGGSPERPASKSSSHARISRDWVYEVHQITAATGSWFSDLHLIPFPALINFGGSLFHS